MSDAPPPERRAEAIRRLRAAPRAVPASLRAWAIARGVLQMADEDSTLWGLVVGSLVTLGPELARVLIAIEPFAGLYVLGMLGLVLLLFRELPSGLRSGWHDARVLAEGSAMLEGGESLRKLKKRRRESGRTPDVALGLGERRIDLRELERVADIDEQGRLRARARVIVAPLLAVGLIGVASLCFAVALVRVVSALAQWL